VNRTELDNLCINTLRTLSIDAVQRANSGHPGAPLGAATMAHVLWTRFLRHNPANPGWSNRDRFVLSAGHASALLYSLLYLTGYDLSLEEIERFRQWGSRAAGHPEYGLTPGVETTTGPLGQGFANGVGMAIAERWLAGRYNREGHNVIDHCVYAIVSDGDLEEGLSSEAASLAGRLGLGKMVYLYDDNGISIEGPTELSFTEDVGARFRSYGWQVIGPIDGMNPQRVEVALREALEDVNHPSLVMCRTVIGYGSPHKAGSARAHGEPLGEEETALTKANLGWKAEEPFYVPPDVLSYFRETLSRGQQQQEKWDSAMKSYLSAYPEEARQLEAQLRGELPDGWDEGLATLFLSAEKPMATRAASGAVLNKLAPRIHNLIGGSADLAPSTRTLLVGEGDFGPADYGGRNLHFGVREHAMGAIANGMAVHGGVIPYTATFLVFYDYMRPAVRLAALMGIRVVFVFTHDSIGVGEDGPTHQPIEQVMGLRSVPNLTTIRPADATETAMAWMAAIRNVDGPTALVLTRQSLPMLDRGVYASAEGVLRGGYSLWQSSDSPDLLMMATGSEVHLALEAAGVLADRGINLRVVSMPSWELFEAQPRDYREAVLPSAVRARISVEAGITLGWERYVGLDGKAIGIDRFGASAPGPELYRRLGLTSDRIVHEALRVLEGGRH
jgi:transketolase